MSSKRKIKIVSLSTHLYIKWPHVNAVYPWYPRWTAPSPEALVSTWSYHLLPRRILSPPKQGHKLEPLVARHLFALLRLGSHDGHARVPLDLVLGDDALKRRVRLEVLHHPLVQGLDVGDCVDDAAGPQRVRVLGVERRRDDARLVLAGFKVRVREADEDFAELGFAEKVGQKLHGVGADAGGVLVGLGVLLTEGVDALLDKGAWSENGFA
ncbi:hypothetical protein CRV24_005620 [Beauveria bassiana]|nr:hypothetical protein CRV24_005620 [Beauveria bassiana]